MLSYSPYIYISQCIIIDCRAILIQKLVKSTSYSPDYHYHEELKFKLDEYSIYLFCKDGKPYEIGNKLLYSILTEILTFVADTDEVEDAVNEIMIALL